MSHRSITTRKIMSHMQPTLRSNAAFLNPSERGLFVEGFFSRASRIRHLSTSQHTLVGPFELWSENRLNFSCSSDGHGSSDADLLCFHCLAGEPRKNIVYM